MESTRVERELHGSMRDLRRADVVFLLNRLAMNTLAFCASGLIMSCAWGAYDIAVTSIAMRLHTKPAVLDPSYPTAPRHPHPPTPARPLPPLNISKLAAALLPWQHYSQHR